MIIVKQPTPPETPRPSGPVRIVRIVTSDAAGNRQDWYSPRRLMREHPELFDL